MPPRIRLPSTLPRRFVVAHNSKPTLPFLTSAVSSWSPSAPAGIRHASIFTQLRANPGEQHKAIRRGRGPSSGKGKTSGRGHKGQKQHGKVPAGFEGGQTPQHIVHGVKSYGNVHSLDFNTVPLSRILSWVAQGRIDPTKPITVRELALSGCVNNIQDGIKLLANSKSHDLSVDEIPPISQPLTIVVSRASKQAIAAVESAGGTVLTRYYTKWAIKKIVEGKMDPLISLQSASTVSATPADKQAKAPSTNVKVEGAPEAPVAPWSNPALPNSKFTYRLPDATSRKAIEYYRDPEKRGYLSYQIKPGQNPSLFFKDVARESNFGKFATGRKGRSTKSEHDRLF